MSTDNDVTFPNFPPAAQTPPAPAWALPRDRDGYCSFNPGEGTYERHFSTDDVEITPDLTVRLHQTETWDHGVVAQTPLVVELRGRDEEMPHHLDARTARWMGLQLLEHAVRLRLIEEAKGNWGRPEAAFERRTAPPR